MPVTNLAELDALVARVKKHKRNLQLTLKSRLTIFSVRHLLQRTKLEFLWHNKRLLSLAWVSWKTK